jgi:hypothetical protein
MAGAKANLPNGQEIAYLPMFNDVPAFNYTIALSGSQYKLSWKYNTRMDRWFLDIMLANDTVILSGLVWLIGRDLTGQFAGQTNVPVGTFFCVDDTNQGTQPTRYSFPLNHSALYLDPLAVT